MSVSAGRSSSVAGLTSIEVISSHGRAMQFDTALSQGLYGWRISCTFPKHPGGVLGMPEVLAQFSEPVLSKDRTSYRAQACGALASDGLWEGWIEFVPVAGGTAVRSPRETTQPNRVDALYWATGLTATYLEGALERALYRPI